MASYPIVVPNRGAKLFKKNIRAELTRDQVLEVVSAGFFPHCAADEMPRQARRTGLTQMGLPYAQDAAITRHLAQFLARQVDSDGQRIRPTAVLFNGGVVQSPELRSRVIDVLNAWLQKSGNTTDLVWPSQRAPKDFFTRSCVAQPIGSPLAARPR